MAQSGDAHDPRTWDTDVSHLDGLTIAALALDAAGLVAHCNDAAQALLSRPRAQLHGVDIVDLVPPDHHGACLEMVATARAGNGWRGRLPMLDPAGEPFMLELSVSPLRREDSVVGVLLVLEDTRADTSFHGRAQRLAERLTRLARVTAELVRADDMDTVTRAVVSRAADAAGATVAALVRRVDDDTLALVGLRGTPDRVATKYATFPIDDTTPAGTVMRTQEPLVVAGRDELDARFPGIYDDIDAPGERTLAALPLNVGPRTIGAILLSFPGLRSFDHAEQEFLGLLAASCAQAMDRISAVAYAEDRSAKLRFLSEASAELTSSLDYEATLRKVAWLGVPEFADWCSISLLEDGDLRTLHVAHTDPAKVALVEELQRRYPPDPDSTQGVWAVVKSGRSELIPVITDELLARSARDKEHLRLVRELRLRSAVSAPLIAHGRVLGVMTWVSSDEYRVFDPADLSFVEDVAQRAAIAIDNSQLHSQTREAAIRLQRAVLPDRLAEVPGWEFSSYYSPSGRTEVGGDFYDVLPVDGGVAMFVGDVMGRGVDAAAAMAQMRAAVRSYAAIDPSPAKVLRRLDTMFEMFDYSQLVTLVYALADQARDELVIIIAGHPPPLLLRAGVGPEWATGAVGAPLGVGRQKRVPFTVPFGEADTMLMYTDGLIERRDEDIDAGQDRLTATCGRLAPSDLGHGLEELVETVRDHTREDDVAALVARRLPAR